MIGARALMVALEKENVKQVFGLPAVSYTHLTLPTNREV